MRSHSGAIEIKINSAHKRRFCQTPARVYLLDLIFLLLGKRPKSANVSFTGLSVSGCLIRMCSSHVIELEGCLNPKCLFLSTFFKTFSVKNQKKNMEM